MIRAEEYDWCNATSNGIHHGWYMNFCPKCKKEPTARELLDKLGVVKHPHTIDIVFRKDGDDHWVEGDFLKALASRVEKVLALRHNYRYLPGQETYSEALDDVLRILNGEQP